MDGSITLGLLSADLLAEVLSWLDLRSLLQCSLVSRLFLVLAKEETSSSPSWAVEQGDLSSLVPTLLERMTTKPRVGVLFVSQPSPGLTRIRASLAALPPDICLIGGCVGSTVMTTPAGVRHHRSRERNHGVLSLGHFPEAEASSFLVTDRDIAALWRQQPKRPQALGQLLGLRDGVEYKVFIVHATITGGEGVEFLLEALQGMYPGAAILGGVVTGQVFELVDGGHLRSSGQGGIVGMAFSGNVPIHAIVSRGVQPVGPTMSVPRGLKADEQGQLSVSRVQLPSPAASGHVEADVVGLISGLDGGDDIMYMGVRIGDGSQQPFVIRPFEIDWESGEMIVPLGAPGLDSSERPVALRAFRLDTDACRAHVAESMARVRQEMEGRGELLGALMFSCNARGPLRFLERREEGVDAACFHAEFPHVPLAGFYAGGEIGPQAVCYEDATAAAASSSSPVSRRCTQSGDVALQSFTCMYALLVVPKRERASQLRRLAESSLADAVAAVLRPPAAAGPAAATASTAAGGKARAR